MIMLFFILSSMSMIKVKVIIFGCKQRFNNNDWWILQLFDMDGLN